MMRNSGGSESTKAQKASGIFHGLFVIRTRNINESYVTANTTFSFPECLAIHFVSEKLFSQITN